MKKLFLVTLVMTSSSLLFADAYKSDNGDYRTPPRSSQYESTKKTESWTTRGKTSPFTNSDTQTDSYTQQQERLYGRRSTDLNYSNQFQGAPNNGRRWTDRNGAYDPDQSQGYNPPGAFDEYNPNQPQTWQRSPDQYGYGTNQRSVINPQDMRHDLKQRFSDQDNNNLYQSQTPPSQQDRRSTDQYNYNIHPQQRYNLQMKNRGY